MRHVSGTRALALIAGLLLAGTTSALAQDTTNTGAATIDTSAPTGAIDTSAVDSLGSAVDSSAARDTTDTSSLQNPPGYRGMERDTTIAPSSGGAPSYPDTSSSGSTDPLRPEPSADSTQ